MAHRSPSLATRNRILRFGSYPPANLNFAPSTGSWGNCINNKSVLALLDIPALLPFFQSQFETHYLNIFLYDFFTYKQIQNKNSPLCLKTYLTLSVCPKPSERIQPLRIKIIRLYFSSHQGRFIVTLILTARTARFRSSIKKNSNHELTVFTLQELRNTKKLVAMYHGNASKICNRSELQVH